MMGDQIVKLHGCKLCSQNHEFTKCPFVFYLPNQRKIVKKLNKPE